MKARIALSMGDPAGIGPELCCLVANDPAIIAIADITVYGSRLIFTRISEACGYPQPAHIVETCAHLEGPLATLTPAAISASAGAAAMASLEAATQACRRGEQQALVTAPINKAAAQLAGFAHPGHTEFLAAACADAHGQPAPVVMALHGPQLTVALATIHCSLKQAIANLRTADLVHVGRLLHQALSQRRGHPPRLACLGLNPHAGEEGLFGDEEQRIISPAIAAMRKLGLNIDGPLAADSAFTAQQRAHYDGFICCYHDQGLIPFKMLHFEDGVNWTLGLPLIRTSPDHGTAFDIAWQGLAKPDSLQAAIALATELCRNGAYETTPNGVTR